MTTAARQAASGLVALALIAVSFAMAPAPSRAAGGERHCSDFHSQRQAQRFFERHDPAGDPYRLDGDGDGVACEDLTCPCSASGFDNGEWVVSTGEASIPESPFMVRINGALVGNARLLTFANRFGWSDRFPQVLVISSSGYLRMKSGGDPSPPLPFGQSLVLGPAIFGSSSSFPGSTLFFNPQIQQVNVDTSRLHRNGKGTLVIEVVALDRGLPATDTHTNQAMNLRWKMTLAEPSDAKTQLDIDGTFRFTEAFVPDPVRTSELQSFRLVQVSSMFIDGARHDVTGFRYRATSGPVEIAYSPGQANTLLPATASPLVGATPTLDSIDADNVGLPNGNAPSYRIRVERMTGPLSGPLVPRAYFNSSQDLNDDNFGLWIYRQPAAAIPAGAKGRIRFKLTATADPLPESSRQVRATPTASVAQAATCAEFPNQAAAQEAANTSDPDGDGIYCESRPCPCSPEWHAQHDSESPPESEGLPPVQGSTEAAPPGSLPRRIWPLRDRRGLHPGLRRVPQRLLAKARRFIRRVRTAAKGSTTGYSREEFGAPWTDSAMNIPWAGNGCDTRNDILRRDLTGVRFRPDTGDCVVEAGRLRDPYLGTTILFSKSDAGAVPIDHVFPLSLAWQMGARDWSEERRVQIANDPLNLLAGDRSSNSSKGDSGPGEWLPPNGGIRCAYSVRFAQVARKYELPVTGIDKRTMLLQCAASHSAAAVTNRRRL